jgi:hypothetical protein
MRSINAYFEACRMFDNEKSHEESHEESHKESHEENHEEC